MFGYPSGTLRVPFGSPSVHFGTLRYTSVPFGTLQYPSGTPRVPFGHPSGAGRSGWGRFYSQTVLLFAGSWGPVRRPYDKPLAVEVLLRHG